MEGGVIDKQSANMKRIPQNASNDSIKTKVNKIYNSILESNKKSIAEFEPRIRDVISDKRESVKEILQRLFYSSKGKDFDQKAVDIFLEIYELDDGKKYYIKDSRHLWFFDKYITDFRQIFDVKRGIVNIDVESEDREHLMDKYITITRLGYMLLGTICKYVKVDQHMEAERTFIGGPLIVDNESGSTDPMYLLVYPEILGCYTFLSWDFKSGKANPRDLTEDIARVIFKNDEQKIDDYKYLDGKIDCVLPTPLDSMTTSYLYRVHFPPEDLVKINSNPKLLLGMSVAKCKRFCYANIDQMLDPRWKPYPEENVFCGDKVKIFAMLRKLDASKNADSINRLLKGWEDDPAIGRKIEYLVEVFDKENSYQGIKGHVEDYFRDKGKSPKSSSVS